jgi:hypothetical protein
MIRRRAKAAGIKTKIGCHTFCPPEQTCGGRVRATGTTTYLENGGTLERAQQTCPPKAPYRRGIAARESPRTTKLYDRTSDQISLDEIERIAI